MTHVFVVNEQTFKVHIEYLFAGTGFGENEPDLNSTYNSKYDNENTLTGMIADISKARVGDNVIFYVTGCKKFFGIFKISSTPFLNKLNINYLGAQLGKYLPFRVKIEPYQIYANGVSELIALDDISNINHPYEMCWSMIYRKLTGMRGCSFLTEKESNYLESLIRRENNNTILQNNNFSYDSITQKVVSSTSQNIYTGPTTITLSINARLYNVHNSHEGHVQAYISQNFDATNNALSSRLLAQNAINTWIGNEVVCSVGERRIDVLIINETVDAVIIRVIELKDEQPRKYIVEYQLPWYIDWVNQYIAPNYTKQVTILPTIMAYPYNRNTQNKRDFDTAVNNFNNSHQRQLSNSIVNDIECIYYNRSLSPIFII